MKSNFTPGSGINVAGCKATHLASEAVAVEDFGPELQGDASHELHVWLFRWLFFQEILSRDQVRDVVVGENRPTVLFAEFAQTPRPFTDVRPDGVAELDGSHDLPYIGKQESSDSLF